MQATRQSHKSVRNQYQDQVNNNTAFNKGHQQHNNFKRNKKYMQTIKQLHGSVHNKEQDHVKKTAFNKDHKFLTIPCKQLNHVATMKHPLGILIN